MCLVLGAHASDMSQDHALAGRDMTSPGSWAGLHNLCAVCAGHDLKAILVQGYISTRLLLSIHDHGHGHGLRARRS